MFVVLLLTPLVACAQGSISVDEGDHPSFRVYQRDADGEYRFELRGSVGPNCDAVEASFAGQPYAVIDPAPTDTYVGNLVASTGQGAVTVRCANSPGVVATLPDLGVGDVYVVAGQSNAEGVGVAPQSYRTVVAEGRMYPTVFDEADVWKVGDDLTDIHSQGGSVWPIVGGYVTANAKAPVAFITTATGGTALEVRPEWRKGGSACRHVAVSCYQNMLDQVRDSGVNAVKAVLWFQGESEAQFGTTRERYNQELDALAANIAFDLPGSPPLVAGVIGPWYRGLAQVDEVRHATIEAWDDNPLVLFGPQSYDIQITGDGIHDDKHFASDDEFQTLGYRWWKALDAHFYGRGDGRGPVANSAVLDAGGTSIVVAFAVASGLEEQSELSVGPWRVTVDGAPVQVREARVASASTVRLNLEDSILRPAVVTVSFAADNSAEGKVVPSDRSSGNVGLGPSALPADPFLDLAVGLSGSSSPPGDRDLSPGAWRQAFRDVVTFGRRVLGI